jgi:hypothetical protein
VAVVAESVHTARQQQQQLLLAAEKHQQYTAKKGMQYPAKQQQLPQKSVFGASSPPQGFLAHPRTGTGPIFGGRDPD